MSWPIPPSSPGHRARRSGRPSAARAAPRALRERDEGAAAATARARRARESAVSPASRAFRPRPAGPAGPASPTAPAVAPTGPASRAFRQRESDVSAARVGRSGRAGVVLRSLALGAVSGARSASGLAAVALTSSAQDRGALAPRLGGRAGTAVAALLAAGELVVDKLPVTPSRLAAPALVPRLALGASAAAAVAQRDGHAPMLPALAGAAGAVAAAVLGARWRAYAKERFGTDLPGALLEDGAAALLGWAAARR